MSDASHDAGLIDQIREAVSTGLTEVQGQGYTDADKEVFGRHLMVEAFHAAQRERTRSGLALLEPEDERQVLATVEAHLWGLGRLQALIDDDSIENIDINGCDEVWVSYGDGTKAKADPVAESDAALVSMIRVAASRFKAHERRWDANNWTLGLRLPDGSRLTAVMAVCERPAVSIRRHRYPDETLQSLTAKAMVTPELASFLNAMVRANFNVMVSGDQDAGKTTLLCALAAVIGPTQRIVTIESSFELGLDYQARHPNAKALEARPPNIGGDGEVTMRALMEISRRLHAERVIVGEVTGPEVVVMLQVMTQGRQGSMATMHSMDSAGVFSRLASYAIQAPERLSAEATNQMVAEAIDFVVHVEQRPLRSAPHGPSVRYVSSVREVDQARGLSVGSTEIWRPGPDGPAVPFAPVSELHHRRERFADIGYIASWGR